MIDYYHLSAHIERKGKVSVKTSEEHEEGSDEIVNGRLQIILIILIIVKNNSHYFDYCEK